MKEWIDLPFIVFFRCVLSFIGVYYITSDRKQEESDEQLLLTNADLFPGMFNVCNVGWVGLLVITVRSTPL